MSSSPWGMNVTFTLARESAFLTPDFINKLRRNCNQAKKLDTWRIIQDLWRSRRESFGRLIYFGAARKLPKTEFIAVYRLVISIQKHVMDIVPKLVSFHQTYYKKGP